MPITEVNYGKGDRYWQRCGSGVEDKVGGLDINPTMRGAFLEMAFELKLKEKCNFRSVGQRKEYCRGG